MELTKHQHLYLDTIYDYFRKHGDWPTFRQVEMKLLPTYRDFDAVEVARSLVYKPYRNTFHVHNLKTPAHLNIDDIRQCQNSEQDLANLVKVVQYSADKYINSNESQVEVSSQEIISNLHMEDLAVQRIGLLIPGTPILLTMQNDIGNTRWSFVVSRDVIHFDGVKSIDNFFEKRDALYRDRNKAVSREESTIDPSFTIEKIAQADPSDFKTIGLSALELSAGYYNEPLKQSRQSFWWARLATIVSFLFFIAAITFLLFRQPYLDYLFEESRTYTT